MELALTDIVFYLFAATTLASGMLVISARNPVHSVLWLILAFFSAAGLFVLMGAEFLAMLLVVVYVGAVAVLFLFVVMMLDINFTELRQGMMQHMPLGVLVGLILLIELATLAFAWNFGENVAKNAASPAPADTSVTNTEALGALLYTDYIFIFQTAGLILLVAMIGAIVLTHRVRPGVRRQNIGAQVRRKPDEAFDLVDVETGEGVSLPPKKG